MVTPITISDLFPASVEIYYYWVLRRIFLGKIITDITGSSVCVGE